MIHWSRNSAPTSATRSGVVMSALTSTPPSSSEPRPNRGLPRSSNTRSHALSNTLKLYQSAGSPNSRRVRIFLAEKGLVLTLVPVDLGKGEQRRYRSQQHARTLHRRTPMRLSALRIDNVTNHLGCLPPHNMPPPLPQS